MLLQHGPRQPLPKGPAAQEVCQTQAVSPGSVLFSAHINPFQCRQVVVSLPSHTHTHTHAPWPGCTSIHSYCRQQPGPHPIPRENVRQSQFSVLLRDTEPCLWVIYLQGQGDQLLSTNELFHFQWGQRKNTLRTPPALNHNVRWRTSSFCPESWSLVAPVIPLLPQISQGSAPPWSSFLPPSSATTLFITQMSVHNGLYI